MVHSHRNVNLAYHNTVAIETLLTKPNCIEEDDCVSLDDVSFFLRTSLYNLDKIVCILAAIPVPVAEAFVLRGHRF